MHDDLEWVSSGNDRTKKKKKKERKTGREGGMAKNKNLFLQTLVDGLLIIISFSWL